MVKVLMGHGFGTNAAIFEAQTAPLRAILPSHWEYHFVEAPLECGPGPGIGEYFPEQQYRCWYRIPSLVQIQSAHEFLEDIIEEEGPFDVAWGFSGGAAILSSLLLHHFHSNPQLPPPFRSAIFMNAYMPWSATVDLGKNVTPLVITRQSIPCTVAETEKVLLVDQQRDSKVESSQGDLTPTMLQQTHEPSSSSTSSQPPHPKDYSDIVSHRIFPELDTVRISIPTAHILGEKDSVFESGLRLIEMCDPILMKVYKHAAAHEIPGRSGGGGRDLAKIGEVVEKTVARADMGL
ncbi:MAG: hypothetical protein Q9166_006308 [cf. Caloplaca sp. 2 TL-2023]